MVQKGQSRANGASAFQNAADFAVKICPVTNLTNPTEKGATEPPIEPRNGSTTVTCFSRRRS